MTKKINKDTKETGNKVGKGHPPKEYQFKEGFDERRNLKGRPKGKRNFKTDFEIAAREIAGALRLGKNPDKVSIELVKRGIREGLAGNYSFWKDVTERIYGKETNFSEIETPGMTKELEETRKALRDLLQK